LTFDNILSEYWSEEQIKLLQSTKILIIGCGGLGSNVAHCLVRSGVKKIGLIDFDKVTYSNLNRQFYFIHQLGLFKVEALKTNLLQINPDLEISTYNIKITDDNIDNIILNYHIVVEAVDIDKTKTLIFEKSLKYSKPVVCASGVAGYGDCDSLKIKRTGFFSIVGDFVTSNLQKRPYSPKVTAIASMQADEVLRMVLK